MQVRSGKQSIELTLVFKQRFSFDRFERECVYIFLLFLSSSFGSQNMNSTGKIEKAVCGGMYFYVYGIAF